MNKQTTFWKAIATAIVWVMVVGALALIGVFLAPEIGEDALGALFMVLAAAVITNGFIWDWGRGARASRRELKNRAKAEEELYEIAYDSRMKRKRDEIGARLSDLTEAELVDLRERLQAGELDDEELAYILRNQ